MTKTYEIRIGKYLQTAWETFLKAPEIFIFATLGAMALLYLGARIPVIGGLINLLTSVFLAPAFYLWAEQARTEGRATFSEAKKLVPVAPQLVVLFIVKSALIIIGTICLVLPGIYLAIAYVFSTQAVCLEGKTFWDALESSRKTVNRNFFGILGLGLVCALIILTGMLFVGVGLLAALPITYLMLHAAYHDIRAQGAEGA